MADFATTHYIRLNGWTLTGHTDNPLSSGTFGWTSWTNVTQSATVRDIGTAGALDRNTDFFVNTATLFNGYFVTVGGQNFGIFTSGSNRFIPYNTGQFDLAAVLPTSGSTSNFTTSLTTAANCFLTGTRIATPQGPRAIETLAPDDRVLTTDGRALPILWVWRQDIVNIHGLTDSLAPILITANALGPGRPARDLIVTADHAMLLNGVLINAVALVNGVTIRPIPATQMPARYHYWHIETSAHEVLLAENCATESYVDYAMRRGFDNYDAYLARYGHDRPIPEMTLPRVGTARLLPPHRRAMPMATSPA